MQKYSIGIFEKNWMICFSEGKYLIRNKKKAKVKKKYLKKFRKRKVLLNWGWKWKLWTPIICEELRMLWLYSGFSKSHKFDAQESKWQICRIEWRRWWWCWQKRWGYYDITLPNKNSASTQNSWFKNTVTKVYSFYAYFLVCCHFAFFGVMFSFPLWNSVKVMHHDFDKTWENND